LKGVKVVRLQTIEGCALLILSDEWLYVQEEKDKLILYTEPLTLQPAQGEKEVKTC